MSLKADLQSGDPLRQAAAMMQLLNAMAGEREVGTAVSVACQALARGSNGIPLVPMVRKLVYNVICGAALSDSDWESAVTGFLDDYGPSSGNPELQVAALAVLPCMPAHKLQGLLGPQVRLLPTLTRQIRSANKEVASAAIDSFGQFISNASLSETLASVKEVSVTLKQWAGILVDSLSDSTPSVAASAFGAVRLIFESLESGSSALRDDVRHVLAMELAHGMLRLLPVILQKSKGLQSEAQVLVVGALMGLVRLTSRHPEVLKHATPQTTSDSLILIDNATPPDNSRELPRSYLIFEQVGYHVQDLLASSFPPVAYEAAKALLAICNLSQTSPGTKFSPSGSWAPLAADTLLRLWEQEAGILGTNHHAQILITLASAIQCLPAGRLLETAKQVLRCGGYISSGSARVEVLARTWAGVVGLDLSTRAARRAGEPGPPAVELQVMLSHPQVAETISATGSESAEAENGEYREEMVCTLIEILLYHPQSVIRPLQAVEEEGEGQSMVATIRAAARIQNAGALLDWLGAARIALQGTKACLGWDREPSGGTYACTLVTDSWLMLLQKSLQAAKALQAAPASLQEAGTIGEAARVAVSYIGSFQELLDQLLMHWQALSAAVQPRALWIAGHHYELAPSLEAGWAHLLQALSTSLGVQPDDSKLRRNQALRSAAASGEMQSVGLEDEEGYAEAIDQFEIRSEAMAVGLIAADRLASLLLHNSQVGPRPGLKEISGAILAILQQVGSPKSTAGPESRERAARIAAFLTPLAMAPAPTVEQGEAITVQTEFGAKLFPSPNWPLDEGFPMAGPAGATLQTTKRGERYWELRSQVQQVVTAIFGRRDAEPEPQHHQQAEAPGLLEVVEMVGQSGEMGRGTMLTAPNDPLTLMVWHKMDWEASRMLIQFETKNELKRSVNGATIRLGLGGPMVPEAKLPPAYKLASLPVGESVTWRFTVRITGFGRVSVQPFISVPAQLALEAGDEVALRCERFQLPLTVLLAKAETVPAPHTFFQTWPSYASGAELTGVCRNRGAIGGLQALTALESGPFSRVMFQPLLAQGGFQAAYQGRILGGFRIALIISGQLLPIGAPPSRLGISSQGAVGHVVCRLSFKSTEQAVITAIQQDNASFLAELFGRTLVQGLQADGLLGSGAPFKLDQSFIPLERLYNRQNEAAQAEEENGSGVGEEDALSLPRKDRKEVIEDAITQEWLRIRSQRLSLAT